MDSLEASRKEYTSCSPSSSDSLFRAYLNDLSPMRQPLKTCQNLLSSYCLLDDLDSAYVDGPEKMQDIEWPFQDCREVESYLFADMDDSTAQRADNEWQNLQECNPQLKQESLPAVKECEDYGEMVPVSHINSENMLRDGSEASEKQCVDRHGFQFEGDASSSCGSEEIELIDNPYGFMRLCEDHLLFSKEFKTVQLEKPAYVDESGKIQDVERPSQDCRLAQINFFADDVLEKQHCHDSVAQLAVNKWQDHQDCTPMLITKPMLNVIEYKNCGEMGSALHLRAEIKLSDGTTEDGQKHGLVRCHLRYEETAYSPESINSPIAAHSPEDSTSSASFEAWNSNSGEMKMAKLSKDSEPTTSLHLIARVHADIVTSESPTIIEPFTLSSLPASVHDNKIISTTDAGTGNSKEFNQPAPKKSKKNPNPTDKKCTCKKSACTKLYCECFAADLYCTESCGCKGCLNRSEHGEKVNNIKNKIKFRNPFAFAPKVVQDATDTPSNKTENDNNLKTSASGRHRNGCKCLKSKCLKNYCECFEAAVGCSSACRCEGCENPNGRKEGMPVSLPLQHPRDCERPPASTHQGQVAMEDALSKDGVEKPSDLLHAELNGYDVHGLLPLTPSLQSSNMNQSSVSVINVSLVTPQTMIPGAPLGTSSSPMLITPNLDCLQSRSSSRGLIKGGKLIFNSVFSFPPSTPHIDFKDKGNRGSDGAKEPERRL